MRLADAIGALSAESFETFCARRGVAIAADVRSTPAEQAARALAFLPVQLGGARLSPEAREAGRLLASAPHGLDESALGDGARELSARGLAFSSTHHSGRIRMPSAYRLQWPKTPSDPPRAARTLLAAAPAEAKRDLCSHHLKRVPHAPWPLWLELPLQRLEDERWVRVEVARLSPPERALITAIEARGSECTPDDVLELEREPRRLSVGGRAVVPRHSAIFSLARRGLVIPAEDGLFRIPHEVERVLGVDRSAQFAKAKEVALRRVRETDLMPARGRLAESPGPASVALLSGLAQVGQAPREGRGVSRAVLGRVAQRLGIEEPRALLLVALSRATGLLGSPATLAQADHALWSAWRERSAWNEACRDADAFRPSARAARALDVALPVRDAALFLLAAIPAQEFALRADVHAAICAEPRVVRADRVLSIADGAAQGIVATVGEVVDRVLDESLPALGLVDVGVSDSGPVLRLSARARAWLEPTQTSTPAQPSSWSADGLRLTAGSDAPVGALVALARYAEPWLWDGRLGFSFGEASLEPALRVDPELAGLRAALLRVKLGVTPELEACAARAEPPAAECELLGASAFLKVPDDELRRSLWLDAEAASLWACPPMADGFVVRSGAPRELLSAVLAKHRARLLEAVSD